ncbi:phosphatase PAP2 family protein [Gillisia hiemivivida]|uniref:Phosphatase PAP2 family protein n=1 Tax=Gillisia hiemivivida TaxID=291190 RepID=A0A5C6ZPY3_9FLAO|nr:phosphatase PAP2 family protein [Gillisia hiemivivida]TXD91835.1 phosphatase PAP2 family protein [Gillisia hiemivivida]
MIKSPYLLIACCLFTFSGFSQEKMKSPYETDIVKDGIWITSAVGLNVLGFKLIQEKDELTLNELNQLSKDEGWGVDRWAAGYYSEKANADSYIPFYASFVMPFALLINENERGHAGQISVLFVETMATTGALFTITAGLVEKSRPLVYNESLETGERIENDEQRSFFAGHTAATAAATFFVAKVFNDFNPDSPLKPYIWGVAAAIPVSVGYMRIKAGKHFLTDNLIGYGVGAAAGVLIPELHKKADKNLQIYPSTSFNHGEYNFSSQGLTLNYQF